MINKKPINILLIEDSLRDAEIIENQLLIANEFGEPNFVLAHVKYLINGLAYLDVNKVDVILLDLNLPDSSGLDTFTTVQKHAPQTPIVVLSGMLDENLAVQAVRTGAQDYLLKDDVSSGLLTRALKYAIERKQLEEKMQQHQEHLEALVRARTAELERRVAETKQLNVRLHEDIAERERTEQALRESQDALRRRNEDLLTLNKIAMTINQARDLDHILAATLDQVLDILALDAGWVYMLNSDEDVEVSQYLRLAVQRGFLETSGENVARANHNWCDEGTLSEIVMTGEALVIVDKIPDDAWLNREAHYEKTLRTFAGFPLKSPEKVLGILGLFSEDIRQFASHEVQLLTTIASQVGTAIENLHLTEVANEIKMLQELDRMRSELIANVSHELRTPLGLIEMYSSALLLEDVDFNAAIQTEFLRGVEEETHKLRRIIDNLLGLFKLQSGRLRLQRQPTDIGQLAYEIAEDLKRSFAMEQRLNEIKPIHDLICDFPQEPLELMIDPQQIEQVLRNLLSNAIKYTPRGGTITIRGRRDGRQIIVGVRDEGIGIPEEDLERIFERFYRVDNEVTWRIGGVGLGLALCRGIIAAHGGHIWAESQLAEGSTFYFTLPVRMDA
jgi:signal transduction histidine kinase/DNA-binding NarL/FixJ family response regulator